MNKVGKARDYFSLITFSHTVFALPFAVSGFFLALQTRELEFSMKNFVFVLLCMVFARSAAMAFNRYMDRDIDQLNERTAKREIPRGIIKPKAALLFVIANSLLFIFSTYFINPLCFYLSPVALFVILGYSITKRFTALCHFVLGIGLALAPIGAYIAASGKFDLLPLIFSAIVFCWVSGFDIIYALQDEKFDKSHHLRSIPSMFGKKKAILLSNLLHLLTIVLIVFAGLLFPFKEWYWIGALLFIGLLVYQHTLVKPNDLSKVNLAFFTLNGFASVLYACGVVGDILSR